MTTALLILGFLFLLSVDVAFVDWRYALGDRPARLDTVTSDGWPLAVWFRPAKERKYRVPVVLCHGLANNHSFMDFHAPWNLARFLSDAGFDVYSVDLRGAGASAPLGEGPYEATVDDHIKFDAPAVADLVLKHSGSARFVWVGHSLGGIVGAAAAPKFGDRLAGLVTIGSPLFFQLPPVVRTLSRFARFVSPWGRFEARVVRLIAPFAGLGPPPPLTAITANLRNVDRVAQRFLVANVFAPIFYGVLHQLDLWTASNVCTSLDGTLDYRVGLADLKCPVLVIGGTVDLLCPPDVTRSLFEAIGSPHKKLLMMGKSYGHSSEYGHGDLVIGTHAPQEVYGAVASLAADAARSDGLNG